MFHRLEQVYELNNPPCIAETVVDDTVIINLEVGSYYSMVGIRGLVWDALCNNYRPMDIITALDTSFKNYDYELITKKIQDFTNRLLEENLLRMSANSANKKPLVISSQGDDSLELEFVVYSDMQELLSLDPIHESDEIIGWPKAK